MISSASVSQADQQFALDSGGDYFLAKPVDSQELFNTLSKLLELTWIYEAAEETIPQTETAVLAEELLPPRPFLENLLELAQSADIKLLREKLDQISQEDERYVAFAAPLSELAKQFRSEDIEVRLQHYLNRDLTHAR
ncbi:hypothetical protein [cf. Phormidesmis sp. LEGE 11477]|uniref:hypothetical protein n=1 Tax=cf. Phormidesmis sp. LEGE 11477 TaxID=1828680 RepID=UPI001881E86E|nr:hypothetical protein [cf. Phormidesmis sp. LEGE 11477]MBE9061697.1 hypothetical protein [cf. Phormidesmis sp. LEGE 11477]